MLVRFLSPPETPRKNSVPTYKKKKTGYKQTSRSFEFANETSSTAEGV